MKDRGHRLLSLAVGRYLQIGRLIQLELHYFQVADIYITGCSKYNVVKHGILSLTLIISILPNKCTSQVGGRRPIKTS